MKTVRIGYSRIYNELGCSLLGRDEVLLRFTVGSINVEAYVGPNPRHRWPQFIIGPLEPKDPKAKGSVSRAQKYKWPSPEKFPADVYTELVATQGVEVDDELADAFQHREKAARDEILLRAKEREPSLITALDYVAGILGLRLHYLLVMIPITEQRFAYRDEGAPYALEMSLDVSVIETHKWNVSDEGALAAKRMIPKLRRGWKLEKAAEVLAWLLQAWAAKDNPILEFVSLFIPLEHVTPELPITGKNAWDQKRGAILAIIKKKAAAQDRNELSKFLTDLRPPPPSLTLRFKEWAAEAALPGWEQDVEAFTKFNKIRNSLVHAGKKGVKSRITVAADDVRTLEDIAERYVSLALFGDANVYKSPKRNTRL